jgi:hypothetical protein
MDPYRLDNLPTPCLEKKSSKTDVGGKSTWKGLGINRERFDAPIGVQQSVGGCIGLRQAGLSLPEEYPQQILKGFKAETDVRNLEDSPFQIKAARLFARNHWHK